jgi:dolichol-phosphate mannosyltransferase
MNLSTTVLVIPAYEPDDKLLQFLRSHDMSQFAAVVVVDDGSGTDYASIFKDAEELGCELLTHSINRGKGRALKTAFVHLKTIDFSDVITVDSDGQHHVDDVLKVAAQMIENRTNDQVVTILGVRDFSGPEIPWKSRFGNKMTSIVTRALFGRYISDTQTGLRGIPSEQLSLLGDVKGERFEYEMNALLLLLRTKKNVQEVPIRTIYNDIDNSHTHFRPVLDSVRILLQIFKFSLSSVIGAGIDLFLYAAIVNMLFGGEPGARGIVIAVVIARVVSSAINFVMNRRLVFQDGASLKHSLVRYYALAAVLLVASAGGSVVLAQVLDGHVVWAKAIVDTALFILSFILQKLWVFDDNSHGGRPRR